jgi:hypothetical protein
VAWLRHGLCLSLGRLEIPQITDISIDTYSDKLLLFPNLNLPWTTTSMIQHLFDDRAGPPVEAAKNGLRTTFQETISEDQTTLKHGQKLSDQKTWNDVRPSSSMCGSIY